MNYVEPQYVHDGQIVWLLTSEKKLLKCQVLVAAGDNARVTNEVHRLDKWVSLRSLRIPEEKGET